MGKRQRTNASFWKNVRDDLVESATRFAWFVGVGATIGGITGFLMGGLVPMAIGVLVGAVVGAAAWWVYTDNVY